MIVRVVTKHDGEGVFPTFAIGTPVEIGESCKHFLGWCACVIDGHNTYVPHIFVKNSKLIVNYNPTELVQGVGDILKVQEIVHSWLLATNASGEKGWFPAEAVISVEV